MNAITDLIAGVPVSDLDASIDWYRRFFGRSPDMRAGDEVLWDVAEHATLFIEPNAAQAGAGRITFAVAGLGVLLEHLCRQLRGALIPLPSGRPRGGPRSLTAGRAPAAAMH